MEENSWNVDLHQVQPWPDIDGEGKNLLDYIYINVEYETLVHVKTIGDVITNK